MAKDLRKFDYKKTATLDAEMWRAYYDHHFFRMFALLLKLMRSQFQFGWILALRAAYYAAVAAIDWRVSFGNENHRRVQKRLVKFYKLISDHAREPFDYKKAAEIEAEWWAIHRYPTRYEKPLESSLAEGMAAIYNGDPEDFLAYGKKRADAMLLRDSKKAKPDWEKITSLLFASWKGVHDAVRKDKTS
ncbi:MAG TPA: hypothetical protein VFM05_05290 [Candidatus Saccharimonadales bacterium]|nr:hypothetical protein [Candidatus Saccharimonadales bacterium]